MEPTTTEMPTTTSEPTTTTPCPPDPNNPCPGDPNSVPKCKRLVNGMITSVLAYPGFSNQKYYYIVVDCIKISVQDNIAELLEKLRLALKALQVAKDYKGELVFDQSLNTRGINTAPDIARPQQPSRFYYQDRFDANKILIATAQANIESMELNISNIQNAIKAASYADWTPEMKQAFYADKAKTYKQNIYVTFEGITFKTVEPRIPWYLDANTSRTDR